MGTLRSNHALKIIVTKPYSTDLPTPVIIELGVRQRYESTGAKLDLIAFRSSSVQNGVIH